MSKQNGNKSGVALTAQVWSDKKPDEWEEFVIQSVTACIGRDLLEALEAVNDGCFYSGWNMVAEIKFIRKGEQKNEEN